MFCPKQRHWKGSILPQFLTSCRRIWQVDKIITEDVNCAGEFQSSAPIIFMTQAAQVCTLQTANFLQMPAEN